MPIKKNTKTKTKATPKKVAKKTATKKVAKKSSVKKASARKTMPKKETKKDLVVASEQTAFWSTDGRILDSLLALREALDEMEKAAYQYHAEGGRNDFANWVEVVLCDAECAAALAKAKTQKSAKTVVVKHLKHYAL